MGLKLEVLLQQVADACVIIHDQQMRGIVAWRTGPLAITINRFHLSSQTFDQAACRFARAIQD